VEEHSYTSTAGYRIAAWVHHIPASPGQRRPAVLLCPGTTDAAEVFLGWRCPLHPDELAQRGFVVMRFDPAGRGASWGEEDWGGAEHQDEVACLVRELARRPDVDRQRIGVVGISMGLVMAAGGAALLGDELAWLLDWEGPSDREILTAGGARMEPANGHPMHDEAWWRPREAVRALPRLRCAYVRLQAERDHAQPGELRHAQRMLNAAASGGPRWFQLNEHPRGAAPASPSWLPSGLLAANRALLRSISALKEERAGT
jgi:hypothetical protein